LSAPGHCYTGNQHPHHGRLHVHPQITACIRRRLGRSRTREAPNTLVPEWRIQSTAEKKGCSQEPR
jgi:hypothetical protein